MAKSTPVATAVTLPSTFARRVVVKEHANRINHWEEILFTYKYVPYYV